MVAQRSLCVPAGIIKDDTACLTASTGWELHFVPGHQGPAPYLYYLQTEFRGMIYQAELQTCRQLKGMYVRLPEATHMGECSSCFRPTSPPTLQWSHGLPRPQTAGMTMLRGKQLPFLAPWIWHA